MNPTPNNPNATAATAFSPQELWGPVRHKFIAMEADKLLTPAARKAVSDLLAPIGQSSLAEIATWADEIKGQAPDDIETTKFLKDFPNMVHKHWHFVDLPLDVTSYDRQQYAPFTSETDVVQMIAKSVDVLQGNSQMMSRINALRWLTHLIGDLHQPLHVACCYIDNDPDPTLLTDPALIVEKGLTHQSDQGGNGLILPLPHDTTLHAYWDSLIPSLTPAAAADALDATLTDAPAGPPRTWAESWAMDSVKKSRQAYQSLRITEKADKKFRVSWEGEKAYNERCAPLVGEQLVLGSRRLALLVNTLFAG
ncbi:S1/P1 nuclease [Chitinophaga sp. G-6-1-13]|uniref:S1/P1 nuclease n=1 Tax=Chitinophaga fulva TaxID=2728842 RepID=A0A848GRI5_9BACT|nr:S1/P1 nuclease [Chitinophaga fulva]NML39692.1 S1/P1 nuclease [Chitinophaga fulva]